MGAIFESGQIARGSFSHPLSMYRHHEVLSDLAMAIAIMK
jgi:hypothetical protein